MMNPHSNDPCSAPLSRTQDKDYMAGLIGDYSSLPSSTYVPSSTGQGWGTKLNQLPCGYSIDQNATSGDTAFGSTSDPLMDNSLIQTNFPEFFPPSNDYFTNFDFNPTDSSSNESTEIPALPDMKQHVAAAAPPMTVPTTAGHCPPYPTPPFPYHRPGMSLSKPGISMNIMSGPYRRHSAPEINAHELDRQQKHANRRKSHNIVEKRYRLNLNEKFRALEEVVHNGTETTSPSQNPNPTSTTASSTPSSLNPRRQQSPKASIIDSALRYIERLKSENIVLKSKVEVLEVSYHPGTAPGASASTTQVNVKGLQVCYDHDDDDRKIIPGEA